MLDLGSTDFHLAVPSVDVPHLETLSTSLFDDWEAFVHQALAIPDYSLFLQIEEGSIKGTARVGAALGAIYMGIANYGGFVSGLATINDQLSAARKYVAERARQTFSCSEQAAITRKRAGTLAAIQNLYHRVQRGEISADEASILAESILGGESAEVPGFLDALKSSLRNCSRHPEQMPLPLEELVDTLLITKTPKLPKRPKPDTPPPLQYRVEVWRESKSKRKHTKVTSL